MLTLELIIAQHANYALTPGQSLPPDVKTSMESLIEHISTDSTTVGPTTIAGAIATASPSSRTAEAVESQEHTTGSPVLSAAAIGGIVVGSVVALAIVAGIFWYA